MDVLYFAFHGICHQMPERSIAAAGAAMPCCARCAGIFVALALAMPWYAWKAARGAATPTKAFIAATVVAVVALGVDGAGNLSFVGLWDTPAAVRFLSGALVGFFVAPFAAELLAMTLERAVGEPMAGGWDAARLAVAAGLLALVNAHPTGALVTAESYAAGAGLVLFLGVAHTALWTLVLKGRVSIAAALSVVTVTAQVAAFSVVRTWAGV
jgi:uncharacterized membrane protein